MTKILKATCHGCWGVILFQLEGWRTAATEECGLRSGCQTQHSSATTEFSPIIKGGCPIQDSSPTNPVTPKSDCAKIPLQPHQKYCIIQCRENLAFHSLLRWKMIILPILTTSLTLFLFRGWENVLFELGSNRVNMRGMYKADELWYKGARNEPVYSLNEFIRLSFNQALPRGELFYHQFSQLYICCGSGGK